MNKKDIRQLDPEELVHWCGDVGEPAFRAGQISEWLWKKGVVDFDQMSNLSLGLREKLRSHFEIPTCIDRDSVSGSDGTIKTVFLTSDGNMIEGVLIPSGGRSTACISTQAGCPLACKFCATGHYGFKRNLTAAEIFDQFVFLNKQSQSVHGHGLDNLVYMGMGEPLLNYEATVKSIHRITETKYGQGLSPRRITVSTVGLPGEIRRLADTGLRIQLAVSLHSALDQKRAALMPVAKSYNLNELSESLQYFHQVTGERITFEYLLLKGVNDGLADAHALARYCKAFPVKINIIEYNAFSGSGFEKADKEKVLEWQEFFNGRNMLIQIRKSKGADIAAACGQLANQSIKK